MNSIDVMNLALNYLGNTRVILTTAEQTTEATLCGRYYSLARRSLLKQFPWGFATMVDTLTLTTETDDKYRYVYEYPQDCLRLIAVFVDGDTTSQDYITYSVNTDTGPAMVIATDCENAKIKYIYDVQDESVMPDEFIIALALTLANNISLPLASDGRMAQAIAQQAAMAVDNAKRMCAIERKEPLVTENKYTAARW